MVDIHCHLLYGLDDGARTLEDSVEMAEMAAADGVTHIVATPHANGEYEFRPALIGERQKELQARFEGRLQIGTGCDLHFNLENLREVQQAAGKFTLNQRNYLLLEFADFAIPPHVEETLHALQLQGLHPIITHPERNGLLRHQPEKLWRWMRQGCYLQITAQSLLGHFGRDAQKISERWLDEERIHFIASDAHNLKHRPPKLHEAYQLVAKRRGERIAQALFRENPLAAYEGRPLPYRPEPPPEGAAGRSFTRRKRFWFF
jgi:protein-tyrosine phosphatase